MTARKRWGAAAAALAVGTAAVAAPVAPPPMIYAPPAPPPGLPKGTPVSIPFAPPLGATLDYSYSRIDEKAGERKRVAFDFALLFERAGAGYRMTVTITVPGLSPEQRADPSIRILEQPIRYRLAADGRILAMEGEDSYWRDVLQIARVVVKDANPAPADPGLMEKLIRHMRSLPDSERLALAASNVAPVLEMAGTRMAVGERSEVKGEETRLAIPTPAMAKMRRDVSVTLDRADPETAAFTLDTRYDDDATRAVMADLANLAPPDKRPDPAAPSLQISDRTVHLVSRATGLTRFSTRRLEGKAGSGVSYVRTIMIRAVRKLSR